MRGLLGKGVLVLGDRVSSGEVTPLPPSKTIVASRMFQPQPKAGVATHRDAFETAQALFTHHAACLEGPEAWHIVSQIV